MKIGIEQIAFYTPRYYLDLADLAIARGLDPEKFYFGLGQCKMSILPPCEDIVTMALNAASKLDLRDITTILFATESSVDQSKSAGIYLQNLLGLSNSCMIVELKQACYSATAALQIAAGLIARNPDEKVLIVASDVSKYELHSVAESSQGCGAVALILSSNPKILELSDFRGVYTKDVMDFWRPNYRDTPIVDGKFSTNVYLDLLVKTWKIYQEKSCLQFANHDFFCYHSPFAKLVNKAHQKLCIANNIKFSSQEIQNIISPTVAYTKLVGNCYTASLYLSLLSLINSLTEIDRSKRIGMYSYGSGAVAEYFSLIIMPEFKSYIDTSYIMPMLESRIKLSVDQYEEWHKNKTDIESVSGEFKFKGIVNHQRIYKKI